MYQVTVIDRWMIKMYHPECKGPFKIADFFFLKPCVNSAVLKNRSGPGVIVLKCTPMPLVQEIIFSSIHLDPYL